MLIDVCLYLLEAPGPTATPDAADVEAAHGEAASDGLPHASARADHQADGQPPLDLDTLFHYYDDYYHHHLYYR